MLPVSLLSIYCSMALQYEDGVKMFCPIDTVNTTRIPTSNSTVASVYVSRLLWPTEHSPKHPKVLILASCEYFPYSYMAASLVHDPIQGNLLLIPPDRLPAITAEEIMRLDPKGSSGLPPIVNGRPVLRRSH